MKTSVLPKCLKWNTFLLPEFSFAADAKKHPCPTKAQLNQLYLQNLGLDQIVFLQLLFTNNTGIVLLCPNFCLSSPDMAEENCSDYPLDLYIYNPFFRTVFLQSHWNVIDVYGFVSVKTTLSIQLPSITLQLSLWCNRINIRLTSVKHAGTLAFISKDSN